MKALLLIGTLLLNHAPANAACLADKCCNAAGHCSCCPFDGGGGNFMDKIVLQTPAHPVEQYPQRAQARSLYLK